MALRETWKSGSFQHGDWLLRSAVTGGERNQLSQQAASADNGPPIQKPPSLHCLLPLRSNSFPIKPIKPIPQKTTPTQPKQNQNKPKQSPDQQPPKKKKEEEEEDVPNPRPPLRPLRPRRRQDHRRVRPPAQHRGQLPDPAPRE